MVQKRVEFAHSRNSFCQKSFKKGTEEKVSQLNVIGKKNHSELRLVTKAFEG